MDLAFDDMHGQFWPKLGTRPVFKFLCALMIYNAKSVFLVRDCVALIISGVLLVLVSLLLIGQQGLGHLFRYRPLLWMEDCANFTPTPEENDQYSANHSYASIKPIHFYQ
jgi:hypothetical protein